MKTQGTKIIVDHDKPDLWNWENDEPGHWLCEGASVRHSDKDGQFYAVVRTFFWPTKGFPTLASAQAWARAEYKRVLNRHMAKAGRLGKAVA